MNFERIETFLNSVIEDNEQRTIDRLKAVDLLFALEDRKAKAAAENDGCFGNMKW